MTRLQAFAVAFALLGSAAVAGEALIPNSLHDAKVGEWVLYSIPDGYQQRHTVVKVEGSGPEAVVTVRVDNVYDGEVVTSIEQYHTAGEAYHPVDMPDDLGATLEISNKEVAVKGKSIRAVSVEYARDDEDDMEWYLSAEVPVYGMIRQYADGKMEYDLLDYGEE